MSIEVISDLPRGKIMELQALVTMLPDSLHGEELAAYLQLVLGNYLRDSRQRLSILQTLIQREQQLVIMGLIGFDKFEEKE